MLSRNAGAAPTMFPLAPPPPPPVFQPLPAPVPHHAIPFFAHPAPLQPLHATVSYPYPNNGGVVVHHAMAPPVFDLQIIPVTAANFEAELDAIGSLLTRYPFVTIDTEYPGTIHRPAHHESYSKLTPPERYKLAKANVDDLPIVQLGITLCDEFGNLPTVAGSHDGHPSELAWEVTFSDFDPRRDRHAPESVAFLQSRGVDFDRSRTHGVSSAAFAAKLAAILSSSATTRGGELTWSAFGGAYDFAYVVKMLTGGRPLLETWHEFVAEARELLGGRVFDAKYMAEHCERADLCGGGLRRVGARLFVQRPDFQEPAAACLAGRKSYSACRVFTAMRRRVLYRDGGASHEGLIDGFHH